MVNLSPRKGQTGKIVFQEATSRSDLGTNGEDLGGRRVSKIHHSACTLYYKYVLLFRKKCVVKWQ